MGDEWKCLRAKSRSIRRKLAVSLVSRTTAGDAWDGDEWVFLRCGRGRSSETAPIAGRHRESDGGLRRDRTKIGNGLQGSRGTSHAILRREGGKTGVRCALMLVRVRAITG